MDHELNNSYGLAVCPNCLARFSKPLPVEPLYSLAESAYLIPMSATALRGYLFRHKDQFPNRRYRKDRRKVLHRMLTASEIRMIRSNTLKFKDNEGKYRPATIYGE